MGEIANHEDSQNRLAGAKTNWVSTVLSGVSDIIAALYDCKAGSISKGQVADWEQRIAHRLILTLVHFLPLAAFCMKANSIPIITCESGFGIKPYTPDNQDYDLHKEKQARQLVQLLIDSQNLELTTDERRSHLSDAKRILKELMASNPKIVELINKEWLVRHASSVEELDARRARLTSEIRSLEQQIRSLKKQSTALLEWRIVDDSDWEPDGATKLQQMVLDSGRRGPQGRRLTVKQQRYIVADHIAPPIEIDASFNGHKEIVSGALLLSDTEILSWSDDHTLIIWKRVGEEFIFDQQLGEPNNTNKKKGHTDWVEGAEVLMDGRILSWSTDHTLTLWKLVKGTYVVSQILGQEDSDGLTDGHTDVVKGAKQLLDGKILTWSGDTTLIIWKPSRGRFIVHRKLGVPRNSDPEVGHTDQVIEAIMHSDGRILSWSRDRTLILWKLNNAEFSIDQRLGEPQNTDPKRGHTHDVLGAEFLPNGKILSWSSDRTLLIWKSVKGQFVIEHRLGELWNKDLDKGHRDQITHAHMLSDGSIASIDREDRGLYWRFSFPDAIQKKVDLLASELNLRRGKLSQLEAQKTSLIDQTAQGRR